MFLLPTAAVLVIMIAIARMDYKMQEKADKAQWWHTMRVQRQAYYMEYIYPRRYKLR